MLVLVLLARAAVVLSLSMQVDFTMGPLTFFPKKIYKHFFRLWWEEEGREALLG